MYNLVTSLSDVEVVETLALRAIVDGDDVDEELELWMSGRCRCVGDDVDEDADEGWLTGCDCVASMSVVGDDELLSALITPYWAVILPNSVRCAVLEVTAVIKIIVHVRDNEEETTCEESRYTAVECLSAKIKCEYAEHYNVRLETDSGHVLAIGEQSETLVECINGRWMAKDSRNTKIKFNRLRCIPTEGRKVIRPCNYSLDMGDKHCDEDATIRYHFDAETKRCLPFKYTGCGGNANNFNRKSHCYDECLPADYFDCPANSPPTRRPDGSADCDKEKRKCPEGSSCKMGFAVGICCDDKNLEKYKANIKPDCGDRKVVLEDEFDSAGTLLGKSCDHQFCPLEAECHRGTYFAYCCQ
nr:Proteinase inhibitor I2 domain containing protein [Haemonchus contortus]